MDRATRDRDLVEDILDLAAQIEEAIGGLDERGAVIGDIVPPRVGWQRRLRTALTLDNKYNLTSDTKQPIAKSASWSKTGVCIVYSKVGSSTLSQYSSAVSLVER